MYIRLILSFILCYSTLLAQNEKDIKAFIKEELYEYEWSEQQNLPGCDFESDYIDLNNTSKEELESSGLFSSEQIENLLFYLYVYGEMKSIYELKMVKNFDYNTIQKILPYIKISPIQKIKKNYVNHSVNISLRSNLIKPDGYRGVNDSLIRNSKKYLGDPMYYGLIYNGKLNNKLSWGIAIEKDAGERSNFIPDYSSFYFFYRTDDNTILKEILLGSFKLRFGQGLIMNNTYDVGYSSLHSFNSLEGGVLRKHNSFSENGFHKGVGVSLNKNNLSVLIYASSNKIDAVVYDSVITSISFSGKHNTLISRERKQNEDVISFGANLNYKLSNFDFGISSVNNRFSKPISDKQINLSNRFNFKGLNDNGLSINWGYKNRYIRVFGEEAYSNNSFAFIHSFIFQPEKETLISFSQRYYKPNFYSFYGRVYGNSKIRNEEGYYLYTSTYCGLGFYLSANLDYFKNLWADASSDFPKNALDLRVRLENRKIEKCNFSLLYKRSKREKEIEGENNSGYFIIPNYKSSYSLRTTYEYSRQFLSQTLLEYSVLEKHAYKYGFHISQIFTWQSFNSKFKTQSIISVFEGKDGIYFYSPLRHGLYSGVGERITGKGYKIQMNFTYTINSSLSASLSYSYLSKSDVFEIGNGLEKINGNNRQIISVLLRYKFI